MTKKILLVDDDADELEIFTEALEMASLKFDCINADSGDKALAVIDVVHPDIIFLDINLPGMNGLDCLKHIRRKADYVNTPVIMYSTGINTETALTAQKLGATACIKKSATIAALSSILAGIFVSL